MTSHCSLTSINIFVDILLYFVDLRFTLFNKVLDLSRKVYSFNFPTELSLIEYFYFKPSGTAPCFDKFGFPSWVYFSKDEFWLTVSFQFISGLDLWFLDNAIHFGLLKTPSFGWCIYFSQEDFIPSARISWHLPKKSYLLPKKPFPFTILRDNK